MGANIHIFEGRIIPARAGFTLHGDPMVPRRRDHPRSRGVYVTMMRSWVSVMGSSPLARGLQMQAMAELKGDRIIPARAGFTRP